jgi:DNA (cytosine-5)-methyltransferase 1
LFKAYISIDMKILYSEADPFVKEQIPIYFENKAAMKEGKHINLLSLFSGCGGMDLGFEGGFAVLKKQCGPEFTIYR